MPDEITIERLQAQVADLFERDQASLEAVRAVAKAMEGLRNQMVETANAVAVVSAALAAELDRAGVISREAFAQTLRGAADEAEQDAPPHLQRPARMDLLVLRTIASHLEAPPAGWAPTVIDGGRPGQDPA